jgi:hypothetical protein
MAGFGTGDDTPWEGGSPPGEGEFLTEPFSKYLGADRDVARFAGRTGLITVVANYGNQYSGMRVPAGVRGPDGKPMGGQFLGDRAQGRLADANRILALELAEHTAAQLMLGLRRKKVSTGRLRNALLDRKNRYSDQFGYGVGRPEFLDQSAAKYWRQIDQGFEGHVGRLITGVWGATLTGGLAYSRTNPGGYPVAGPAFTAFGMGGGQGRLKPMGRKWAYRLLRKQAGTRDKAALKGLNLGTQGVIENPIEAEEYFLRGWRAFNARERTVEVVKDALRGGLS